MLRGILVVVLLVLIGGSAEARRYHHAQPTQPVQEFCGERYCGSSFRATSIVVHTAGRPSRWCGWWMGIRHNMRDRALWVAARWAHIGRPAPGPAPGVIGVMRHHVYEVVQVTGPHTVIAISGNDGHAVRTRERSTAGTFAWRYVDFL